MTVKKSLFIQVQWYDKADLVKHLEHVYREHRDRGKDDYIHNVVLDEIGNSSGLSSNLDLILPYLPGGAKRCFDNVFVGSHFVKWPGPGSAYKEGMLSASHRWINLKMQKQLWQKFRAKYPQVPMHFYVNHEGVLNLWSNRQTANAYEAYLIQSRRDANAIKPHSAMLWSPAIWSRLPLTWYARRAVTRVFTNIQRDSKNMGTTWLHLQDMQGRRWPPPLWVVKTWYHQLKKAYNFASLRVNMELFRPGLSAASLAAIRKTEAYYKKYGIPVGASWELRYWYESHDDVT